MFRKFETTLAGRPLVIEIPDRHGSGGVTEAIGRYVEEAIGIKL